MVKQTMVHLYHGILFSSKKNKLLMHGTSWMNLKGIILSEESHPQKVTCCMIPLISYLNKKIIDIKSRLMISRDERWGEEEMGSPVVKQHKTRESLNSVS
jgi:hypothetical protein